MFDVSSLITGFNSWNFNTYLTIVGLGSLLVCASTLLGPKISMACIAGYIIICLGIGWEFMTFVAIAVFAWALFHSCRFVAEGVSCFCTELGGSIAAGTTLYTITLILFAIVASLFVFGWR